MQFCRRGPTFDAEVQVKSQGGIRIKVSDVLQYLAKLATGRQPHWWQTLYQFFFVCIFGLYGENLEGVLNKFIDAKWLITMGFLGQPRPEGLSNKHMKQFEIERRSCGQSMTNFRFFSCEGQNHFTGCHSFLCPLLETYKKNGKKTSKINPVVALH